ncbi:sensor histidine kinase [Maritalea myrionectae]|uniref:sensor histidine kinase n=1 Tax=Maritalea myrionectae TaxID=454601 RepID=UPI00042A2E3B|nr:ATP-binding protein [Maritalea myrionectae]
MSGMDSSAPNRSLTIRWRDRFYAARWVLLACSLVFLALYLGERLTLVQAILSFGVIFLAAIAVPRRAHLVPSVGNYDHAPSLWPDTSTKRFAEALPDPCLIVDHRVILRYRNKAAAGEFPSTSIGDPLSFSLRNPLLLNTIEKAIAENDRAVGEFRETVPAASWYKVSAVPLEVQKPGIAPTPRANLFVVTIDNQTEQRSLDQMRADFVANASHELRTPLTSLMGFLDTLMGPAANDAKARDHFLGIMRGQAERMSRLIDDLLSLSRIELRQHQRPTTKVDLGKLIKESIEMLQPQITENKAELSFSNQLEGTEVTGDRNELTQVVTNLLENAIKYGHEGGQVEVRLEKEPDHHNHEVRITVKDNGPGIPAEHVPRLTERFYRVDAESSRRKKGTGLGLAIVKHIVSRHRGELRISSVVGEGTEISVFLPL